MNEKPCLHCELSKMVEALRAMDSFFSESMGEKRLEEDYKASQLDVAFKSANCSLLILRDLFREFAENTGWGAAQESENETSPSDLARRAN